MVDLPRSTFLNLKYLTYYFIPLSNRPSRSLELNLLARLMSEESLTINDYLISIDHDIALPRR